MISKKIPNRKRNFHKKRLKKKLKKNKPMSKWLPSNWKMLEKI